MKTAPKTEKKIKVVLTETQENQISVIPVVVGPNDLDPIYNYFMRQRPSKKLPFGGKHMIMIFDGEGGNA